MGGKEVGSRAKGEGLLLPLLVPFCWLSGEAQTGSFWKQGQPGLDFSEGAHHTPSLGRTSVLFFLLCLQLAKTPWEPWVVQRPRINHIFSRPAPSRPAFSPSSESAGVEGVGPSPPASPCSRIALKDTHTCWLPGAVPFLRGTLTGWKMQREECCLLEQLLSLKSLWKGWELRHA